ncbi:MAG: hypothetical protein M1158_01000 [Candidatus Marsarchaeota archaeon]|nr:hypothetical protein [Candidatus Marsarchaeota archaeon]
MEGQEHTEGNNATARPSQGRALTSRYVVVALLALVVVLAVYMRLGMLGYQGFFEPDGFFHYAVIRAAVANHLAIPMTLSLSGFPVHNNITEPLGFYFMTLVPYALLMHSVSYYTIQRLVPVLFGVLDAIGAFFLMRHLAKSNVLALAGAFFVAVSSGDIARTAALVYRGDGFITIFMIVALLLMLRSIESGNMRRKALWAVGAAFILGVGTMVWGGAPYTVIVYIFGVMLLVSYGFITAKRELLASGVVLSLALLVTYAMQHMWMALRIIRGQEALSSTHFLIFYAPLLAGAALLWYIVAKRERFAAIAMNAKRRLGFLVAIAFIALIAIVGLFSSYLVRIAGGDGLVVANSALNLTIQELQKPTFAFLWGSFGFALFLAPIGVLLYLFGAHRLGNYAYSIVGKAKLSITPAFLLMLSYFIVTGYLQANAIRFNSLVAVPIAVFAAYGAWGIYVLLSRATGKLRKAHLNIVYTGLIIALLAYGTLLAAAESYTAVQADDINSLFLQAMTWLKTNTPSNATVLAVWPDGSVIEGWANRTSVTDSVGGQNSQLIAGFADFILNDSPDVQYLYATHEPQYLVARGYWYSEFAGIAQEGNVTNATAYGYSALTGLNIVNVTNGREYEFSSSSSPYRAVLLANTSGGISAGIGLSNSSQLTRIKRVMLYNADTGNYTLYNATLPSLNYTLLVSYANRTITGGTILGPKLFSSNAFKFTFTCTNVSCSYGNGTNVSMQLVYQNSDTRIFKINYS